MSFRISDSDCIRGKIPVGWESFLPGAAKYSSLKKSLQDVSLIVKGTLFGCLSEKALGTHLYFLADENSSNGTWF